LISYNRVQEFFADQMGIPISEGSVYNFNVEAYNKLKTFEAITKDHLINAPLAHVDETGININGDRHWLHCVTNASWTFFFAHKNRDNEATDPEGILPAFKGVLCHDHWKPYYCYSDCLHALCNTHHLRELTRSWEQDDQKWAKAMQDFLEACNRAVHDAGGKLCSE
jgi:transposase